MNTFIVSFDISSRRNSDRKNIDTMLTSGSLPSSSQIEEQLLSMIMENSTALCCKPTSNFYIFESNKSSLELRKVFSKHIDESTDTVFILNICNPQKDYQYYGVKRGDRPEINDFSIAQLLNNTRIILE